MAQVAGQAAGSPVGYFTDMLFRSDHPDASGDGTAARGEVGRILATDALSGDMPSGDRTYVAQVVAARTGLSPADAEKRVSDVIAQAKDAQEKAVEAAKAAAEAARKTGVYVALWAFIALLVGAFSASIWRPWGAEFGMICPFPANPSWNASAKRGAAKLVGCCSRWSPGEPPTRTLRTPTGASSARS